jgi:hypothetical protein
MWRQPSDEQVAMLDPTQALLTSGYDSPLYNPDVPAEELEATLDRAHATLGTPTALSQSTPTSQGGTACR